MSQTNGENREWIQTLAKKAGASRKSRGVALLLSIFLGFFGLDRFYLGYYFLGSIKFLLFFVYALLELEAGDPSADLIRGLLAIGVALWWLVDIVLLSLNRLRDAEGGVMGDPFRT